MRRYKFSDLLTYEDKIKALYLKFGLNFNPTNRISRYFAYLKDIERARHQSKDHFSNLIKKDKARYYFSQYYVLEMCNIFDALENSNQDKKIVREKLIDLSKGTYLLSEESSNNTKARDTTFELSLFSFLRARKLNAKLCDPNPDLLLPIGNFVYNIECKRPNSSKSLERHIKDAVIQLEKTKTENSIPTVALSLEQIILGGDFIFDSTVENNARSYLDTLLYLFHQENLPLIQKICGSKEYLILYYFSCLTGLKDDFIMANATFIIGNLYNFEENLSNQIYKDLQKMIPIESLSSLEQLS